MHCNKTGGEVSGDAILAKRIIELQIRELTDDMAEVDYQLAIARQNVPGDVSKWLEKRVDCLARLHTAESTLQAPENRQSVSTSALVPIIDRIVQSTTRQDAMRLPIAVLCGIRLYVVV
jgi:hypothetical protein